MHENNGIIKVSSIRVPEKLRNKGLGTNAMNDLVKYADKTNQKIALTPSTDFGASSLKRLYEFYNRFGFEHNTGKSRDLSISESMIRNPKTK